jgi:hypothetical protein
MLGQRLKEQGLNLVESNNQSFVDAMRELARAVIKYKGTCSMDDLRVLAEDYGIEPNHPNAYGAVFNNKEFKAVDRIPSVIPSNHYRKINLWRLA